MRMHVSTADLPPRGRFATFHDVLHSVVGVAVEAPADDRPAYEASFTVRASATLSHLRLRGDGHPVSRGARDVGRRAWDAYAIYAERSPGTWFDYRGSEFTMDRGEFFLGDADMPFRTRAAEHYNHHVWLIPKPLLDPYLPARSGGGALKLLPGDATAGLVHTYLDALTRNWDAFSAPTMGAVTDTLCRLVGIAAGCAAAEQPEALRQGRLTQAKRYIAAHLASPELSPGTVAAALGMSVRALHLLFEPAGTSFARYVLQQRLKECRAALLADPARPVIDIAFAWGFGSLSSFYRAFQAAFGVSPGDARAMARDPRR